VLRIFSIRSTGGSLSKSKWSPSPSTSRAKPEARHRSSNLKKLETAGVVRLDKGEGRTRRPVLAARKVYFEIDLLGSDQPGSDGA
jgi:predicted transcriptional regulator